MRGSGAADHHVESVARACRGVHGLGATALVHRAHELLHDDRESSLSARVAGGEALTALMIGQEAGKGDALATELVMELATHLGRGMVTIGHIIDPEAIILGGAMTFGGIEDPVGLKFLAQVTQTFRSFAFPTLVKNTRIVFATLGSDAGYVGAAGIARREHLRSSK